MSTFELLVMMNPSRVLEAHTFLQVATSNGKNNIRITTIHKPMSTITATSMFFCDNIITETALKYRLPPFTNHVIKSGPFIHRSRPRTRGYNSTEQDRNTISCPTVHVVINTKDHNSWTKFIQQTVLHLESHNFKVPDKIYIFIVEQFNVHAISSSSTAPAIDHPSTSYIAWFSPDDVRRF